MKKGYRYNKKVLEQIKKANEKAGNKDIVKLIDNDIKRMKRG